MLYILVPTCRLIGDSFVGRQGQGRVGRHREEAAESEPGGSQECGGPGIRGSHSRPTGRPPARRPGARHSGAGAAEAGVPSSPPLHRTLIPLQCIPLLAAILLGSEQRLDTAMTCSEQDTGKWMTQIPCQLVLDTLMIRVLVF